MMRLVTASEMKEMDGMAIRDLGIPGAVLMENAGRAATRVFLEYFRPKAGARVLVVCGRGNNGGDGYVMARYLQGAGLRPSVVILCPEEKIEGDALTHLRVIRRLDFDIQIAPGPEPWLPVRKALESYDYVLDGILGTGLNSPVREYYAAVIDDLNASGRPITAIDIPSGLNAETGQVMGTAVRARLTVTFGFPKVGQVIYPGAALVGRLVRVDIGIPEAVSGRVPATRFLAGPQYFRDLLGEEREDTHKGHRGHLLVLAGSTGKTGAATLACLGALRAGAGLVTLGVPETLNPVLEGNLIEAMTVPLPDTGDGHLAARARDQVLELLEGKTALAVGPGLSTHPETVRLVREVVSACPLPMVIDADGLNALAEAPGILEGLGAEAALTPHPGEMGRLTGTSAAQVQENRVGTAVDFANRTGCHLVLKGARTLIASPRGRIYVNPTGNPLLSSGGSGDVLTGLMGGFLARRAPTLEAALAAVYLHGLAADLLAERMGRAGVLASELLGVIPGLMKDLHRGEHPLTGTSLQEDLVTPL
ncbi:MAG: bifunctional ADP-dependent NAD(P)H-hydrate dehydratase/NAD(P)H-hydrate epimerase [Deltaproteobacteria bacterium]|nr:MAG: bifunctional ADP-dependent NAD(P)H-hydrate dehydratase/NAD(P)H-hydrate epimerase [Deltaproteobacteria bacterium]